MNEEVHLVNWLSQHDLDQKIQIHFYIDFHLDKITINIQNMIVVAHECKPAIQDLPYKE